MKSNTGLLAPGGNEVYTWGWKECVPSGKLVGELSSGANSNKEYEKKNSSTEQGSLILFIYLKRWRFLDICGSLFVDVD